jgi:hypothetical protein
MESCLFCNRIVSRQNIKWGNGHLCPQCDVLKQHGLYFLGLSDEQGNTQWYLRGNYQKVDTEPVSITYYDE